MGLSWPRLFGPYPGSERLSGQVASDAFSPRAPPLHGHAIRFFVRNANQFRPSAHHDRVGEAVETPLGILVCGAIGFLWKARVSLADTKLRRSKRIDQVAAANPIQGRNVRPGTGGHEVPVFLATDGNLNQALAKGLEQLLASVIAMVTRRTAGNQKRSHGDRGCKQEFWVVRNHPLMMPPLVARTKSKPTRAAQHREPRLPGPELASYLAALDASTASCSSFSA
jgi:hypothetical protein